MTQSIEILRKIIIDSMPRFIGLKATIKPRYSQNRSVFTVVGTNGFYLKLKNEIGETVDKADIRNLDFIF